MTRVELADVQRLVLQPSKHPRVCHWLLHFESPEAGRVILDGLLGAGWPVFGPRDGDAGHPELAVGLTAAGLEALGVPDAYLSLFRRKARAFAAGAPLRSATRLGDVGASAATHWDPAFAAEELHAIVTCHHVEHLDDSALSRWRDLIERRGAVLGGLSGERLGPKSGQGDGDWVHFEFRDGLARPCIRVDGSASKEVHEPGELLLGHVRDLGDNPWSLVRLPEKARDFFANGSFGVLRVIEQNEFEFGESVRRWAKVVRLRMPDVLDERSAEQYVRAKLCGRWPSGAALRPGAVTDPGTANGAPASSLDFRDDPIGCGCPLGSHVRRMNPGDGGAVHSRPRPLFRRGMPYGTRTEDDRQDDKVERGLLGLFFCADIEDQFEHLLGEWADRSPVGQRGAGTSKDPLIGTHERQAADLVLPICDGGAPLRLSGFKPFVRTRGTAYAFYPSRASLKQMQEQDFAPEEVPWQTR